MYWTVMGNSQGRTNERPHCKSQHTSKDLDVLLDDFSEVNRMLVSGYQSETEELKALPGHFSLPKYLLST